MAYDLDHPPSATWHDEQDRAEWYEEAANHWYGRHIDTLGELHALLYPEAHPFGSPGHDPDHVYWQGAHSFGPDAEPYQWSPDTLEFVAAWLQGAMSGRSVPTVEQATTYPQLRALAVEYRDENASLRAGRNPVTMTAEQAHALGEWAQGLDEVGSPALVVIDETAGETADHIVVRQGDARVEIRADGAMTTITP